MHILAVGNPAEGPGSSADRLERHGHDVTVAATGTAALEAYAQAGLVLLDLDLPDIDGLEVCRRMRETAHTPIIAFTAGGDELDRVLALRAGADDCLDKPYEVRELIARIEAVTRRTHPREGSRDSLTTVSIGGLSIDAAAREVMVRGRPISLTRKEFDLLYYLARHSEKVVSRQRLMQEIWEDPRPEALGPRASRTVDTHVSSLRSKLGHSDWIRTVRGVGFRVGHV
ncbi:DNA-binding response regulator [Streptomyces sp. Ru71]|uniref:response regulator transcription factor n=1 Tax=Streptomyces sp. Ru71 TaxID=2080746 RepID=UPI000CDDFCAB|nr:response regulator transcription factor [Streptomyces sp. Ru71]POX55052.1 DNA-binding response regulator [Streptomyces sp. Ru71]